MHPISADYPAAESRSAKIGSKFCGLENVEFCVFPEKTLVTIPTHEFVNILRNFSEVLVTSLILLQQVAGVAVHRVQVLVQRVHGLVA